MKWLSSIASYDKDFQGAAYHIQRTTHIRTVDAAKQLGLCEKTIRNHVKAKKLKAKIVANGYLVHASELSQP